MSKALGCLLCTLHSLCITPQTPRRHQRASGLLVSSRGGLVQVLKCVARCFDFPRAENAGLTCDLPPSNIGDQFTLLLYFLSFIHSIIHSLIFSSFLSSSVSFFFFFFSISFYLFILAVPPSLWDLSSLARGWTRVLGSENSVVLTTGPDHQGIPLPNCGS